jgi:NADPH2:quinone reductase
MGRSIRIHRTGGLEVLQSEDWDPGPPGPFEVRIRQTWAGVNFVDVYHRTGLYPLPGLPAVLGVEAVGRVEAIGAEVAGLAVGQRVAWAGLPAGGYAQVRLIAAPRLLPLPADLPDALVAGMLLRGLTAHMLLRRVRPLAPGDSVLVQAAAGGLGQVLVRWAKRLGARVIGVVGSEAKAAQALAAGADRVVVHSREDVVAAVRRETEGRGVDVAYDGIGGDMLLRTLDCVRPFGLVASVGQASGSLPAVPLAELGPRRSLALARPSVFAYAADPDSYRSAAAELFALMQDGLLLEAGGVFPLAGAAEAHRALEGGRTTGAVLLDLA